MKPANKKIANLIFALAASLAAAGSVAKVDPAVDKDYEVFGPSNVEAGSLVLLSVQGTDVQWDVFPNVPIETYGEENAYVATSFQNPGDYLVVCGFVDDGGRVRLERQLIESVDPTPTVAPPLPPSVVEPIEVVVIEPIPDPYPNTMYPDVADKIIDIATKSNLSKETARAIGENFGRVASQTQAGVYSEPSEILRDTAALNRPIIKVGAVTTQIQLLISKKRFAGEVVSLEDYQDLWTQISEGLTRYAER